MKRTCALLSLLLCICCCGGVRAQLLLPDLHGTDFWLSFIPNLGGEGECSLQIVSESSCTAYVECPSVGFDTVVMVPANRSTRVPLPAPAPARRCGGFPYPSTYHVTTTSPAVVYASNYKPGSQDISAILPTDKLRCDYIAHTTGMTYDGQTVAIVAVHDSTEVQIVLGEAVIDFDQRIIERPGDLLTVTLQRGEGFMLRCPQRTSRYLPPVGFSGTRIHSTHPVAVFQGHRCADVTGSLSCDHLYEQCHPVYYWGRRFMVIPTAGRTPYGSQPLVPEHNCIGDMVKVSSLEDNCVVKVMGTIVDTIGAGETYTCFVANHPPVAVDPGGVPPNMNFFRAGALYIETSQPATTCFYVTSQGFGGSPGDPASVIVPPLEQTVSHAITGISPSHRIVSHRLNLVAPTADTAGILLDGHRIASRFIPTPFGYSWASLPVDTGTHVVDADSGHFVATCYGLGDCEAYAHVVGCALRGTDYDVRVSRHQLCSGDSVVVEVRRYRPDLALAWQLDGRPLASTGDSLHLHLDAVGEHRLRLVVEPIGDTVWNLLNVHPDYFIPQSDTICPGDSLGWQSRWLKQPGQYKELLPTSRGCDSLFTMQLSVLDPPRADLTIEADCRNFSYRVHVLDVGDTTDYRIRWHSTPHDETLHSQPWDSLLLSPKQPTVYRLSIRGRCSSDTTFTLKPIQWPVADMEVWPDRLSYDRPEFEAHDRSLYSDGRSWWVDGEFAGRAPVLQSFAPLTDDTMELTLVAYNGACTDTLSRRMPIMHVAVWAPNAFSPGSNTDQRFYFSFSEAVAIDLFVYDRMGNELAHLIGPDPQWDGTHDGSPCPQGAYVWVLRYRRLNAPDAVQTLVGTVTLLR